MLQFFPTIVIVNISNLIKSKDKLTVPLAATRSASRCRFYGGRRTREKPSNLEAWERSTTTTLLTRVLSFLRINTRLYPGGHPSSYNCLTRLNLKFCSERQHILQLQWKVKQLHPSKMSPMFQYSSIDKIHHFYSNHVLQQGWSLSDAVANACTRLPQYDPYESIKGSLWDCAVLGLGKCCKFQLERPLLCCCF